MLLQDLITTTTTIEVQELTSQTMQWTTSLSDVLMMDHQMTEQTTTPLVVTTRLLVEEDVEPL